MKMRLGGCATGSGAVTETCVAEGSILGTNRKARPGLK
jgi:hypothetical protein